mgnify:CR=1 FL=1
MKQFIKVAVATAAFVATTFAQAGVIDIETEFKSNTKLSASKTTAGFFFDLSLLNRPGFTFNKGVDVIESASLKFKLNDNGGTQAYTIQIALNEIYKSPVMDTPHGGEFYSFTVPSTDLLSFASTGVLNGSDKRDAGEFTFNTVTLNASIRQTLESSSAEVPEPLGVTLFGIGMMGLLAARRKAKA